MDLSQAVITGIIQGLTEFLPVSSSGHLVLTASIYKMLTGQPLSSGGSQEVFFDIMLHVGTLVAVIIYFRKDIQHLFSVFLNALRNKTLKTDPEAKFLLYISAGTLATIVVAFPLKDFFESLIHQPSIVGLILIITGILLFYTEILSSKIEKKVKNLNWKKSIIIGLAQGLAVAPGLSRSGSTIAAGLATGLDRVTSARYSFLLSIPIIIMAALFHALEMTGIKELATYNWYAILLGTLVAGIVGYFCIKYFIIFISKHRLNVFAIYCWIVGVSMFVYFTFFA
jgi:undecaprenyl-diphosphatase